MFTVLDIAKFGLFNNFRWKASGLRPLSRVNIFYGRNYSGKTTLSRIFDCVAQGTMHKDYTDGDFTLTDSTGTITDGQNLSSAYNVRVYNCDYVKRNLGWLSDEEEGEIVPFALIGGDNVKAQQEIERIEKELGSVEDKSGLRYEYDTKRKADEKAWKAHADALQALENKLKEKANRGIKTNKYFVRQGTNYNINSIKYDIWELYGDIDDMSREPGPASRTLQSEQEKGWLKTTVDEVLKPTLAALPETEPHLKERREAVIELVQKRITLSQTLQELVDNDLLQTWVDQGRELNKGREKCAFCGNPIPEKRWEALNAHFSKESEELKTQLNTLKQQLENAGRALDGYLESKNFTEQNIYVAYVQEYKEVKAKWDSYVEAYKKEIERLIGLIDERLLNIFRPIGLEFRVERLEPVEGSELLVEGGFIGIVREINELIGKNNDYSQKQDGRKEEARKLMRQDEVYRFCEDNQYVEEYRKLKREEADLQRASLLVSELKNKVKQLENEIKQKELEKKDEGLAAQKISRMLVNHFGNGSLSLESEAVEEFIDVKNQDIIPARTRFVVKRGGEYAKNLSEGEKSLIAFCYFIAQIEDELEGGEAGKLVIFIDDPISSLDNNHIFFMFSLIDKVIAEKKRYGQLFVSTHNLEFLKYVKRMTLPRDEYGKALVEHYIVKKLRKGDTDDYRCVIEEMPDYLRDYVTEYNFLFEQIYTMAKPVKGDKQKLYANAYTLYYSIGNTMRKFLECFLFYKYPSTDHPLDNLDRLFEDHVPAEVNRIVNEFSHAYTDRGLSVVDVPEMETAAKLILNAVKAKDPEHYEALCGSIGVMAV